MINKKINNIKMIQSLIAIAVITGVGAPAMAEDLNSLEKRIQKLEQKTKIKIGGRLHLDLAAYDDAYNPGKGTGSDIYVRRARVYFSSAIDDFSYKVILNYNDEATTLHGATVTYNGFKNGIKLSAGKLKEDFSLQGMTSSNWVTSIERTMVSDVFNASYNYGVQYAQALSNGIRYSVSLTKDDDFADGNEADGSLQFATTGRLTYSNTDDKVLHLGLSASHRNWGTNDFSIRQRGEVRLDQKRLANFSSRVDAEEIDASSATLLLAEFGYQKGRMHVSAEYGQIDVSANSGSDETFEGGYAQVGYFLGDNQRKYNKGSAKWNKPSNLDNQWEVFARFSTLDMTTDSAGTKADVITLGANHYINSKVRMSYNYVLGDVSGPSQAALSGTDDDGQALVARLQYLF